VSIPVEERLPIPRLVELAQAAERNGYDTVLAGEVSGADVFALLSAVAVATERISIGTGVVPMATRGAPLLAMGFQSLASLAPGRVLAGVGVSSPTIVDRWHGRDFAPPLSYAREFLPALRRALDGERLEVRGEYVRSDGFRTTLPAGERIPVILGAMRPQMIRLAGELADGLLLTWCPPDEAAEYVSLLREGAERAGRNPSELLVGATFFGYAGPDPVLARERMRRYVLQYASVSTHRDSFARSIPNLEEVEASWLAGDRRRALSLISDESLDRLTPLGADAVVRRARDLHDAGIDLPVLVVTAAELGDAAGPLATIETVAAAVDLAPAQAGA
jgi:probable F420-dependent oxidoreductase